MIKKLILILALIALLSLPADAVQVSRTLIAETTLTKGDSEATATLYTGDTAHLTFFVDYTPDNNEEIDITFDVSYDGTNWMDANFYDYTASAVPTLQDTETITTDIWYYAYWENKLSAPYVRIHIIGDTWLADSEATVTVYVTEQK